MALRGLLGRADVQDLFEKTFKFEPYDIPDSIRAKPHTSNPKKIGIAFDNLARLWLKRRYAGTKSKPMFAENMSKFFGTRAYEVARSRMERMDLEYRLYIKTGTPTAALVQQTLHQVGLDAWFHTGEGRYVEERIDDNDITDLLDLYGVMMHSDLNDLERPIRLQVEFGTASDMVGGAQADIIAADTLIDTKVTMYPTFTREYYNQVVGYVVLHYLDRDRFAKWFGNGKLKRFGVYFARHGVLKMFPASQIYEAPKFDQFVDEFCRLAGKYGRPRRSL